MKKDNAKTEKGIQTLLDEALVKIDALEKENKVLWKEQSTLLDQISRMNEVHRAQLQSKDEQIAGLQGKIEKKNMRE